MGSYEGDGHRVDGRAAAPPTALTYRGDPTAGDRPARCLGRSSDRFGRRVRPCVRPATLRVTGTHGLTADLCVQHARVAADRPRFIRAWLLEEMAANGAADPPGARPRRPEPEAGYDLTVRVAAQIASVVEVRDALTGAFRAGGWPEDLMPLVVLAVGEAVANAIEHGSMPGAAVEVAVTVRPHWATVRVADEGRLGAAIPLVAPARPPATRIRGRGLLLMLDLAERVEVDAGGAGTSVLLRFARYEGAPEGRPAPGPG
ncbi:MAG TPA: ATP-binding protein [Miltoncostaea sp.]|nr:ATP-binding protein [Miltoncostaea sp.]